MKIAIIDLDTSHPAAWLPVIRQLGHEVTGIFDGGSVHPASYVHAFADEHRIPRLFSSLHEAAESADCAVIHGCDWDTHIDKARPFVDMGKSVLLDKPMAGNIEDLRQVEQWIRQGRRITGGSSLRFAREIHDWLQTPMDQRGSPHTALCGCAVDEFNYGIHAYTTLLSLLGSDVHSVRHLGRKGQRRIQVNYPDGRMGLLVIGQAANWMPFYQTVITDRASHSFIIDASKVYAELLSAVLPYLSGQTDQPPIPLQALLQPERCALAARRSWLENDRQVHLDELNDTDRYNGAEFARSYKAARYPPAS